MAGTTMRLNGEKLLLLRLALLFGVLCLIADPALSENFPPIPTEVMVKKVEQTEAGIHDRLQVTITNLAKAVKAGDVNPRKLALYLDGRVIPGIYAEPAGDDVVEFYLERTDKSKQAWLPLLGSPTSFIRRDVTVRVGYEDKIQIPAEGNTPRPTINFRVFHVGRFFVCTIVVLGLLGLCIWLAICKDILRDSTLVELADGTKRKPFSLARCQMAVWFFLVVSSFLFLYVTTGDYNILTEQAVMLIGIGSGTALGAAVIDVGKRNVLDREREALTGLKDETEKLMDSIAEIDKSIEANPERQSKDQPALSDLKSKLAEMNVRQVAAETKKTNASAVLIKEPSTGVMDLLTDANGVSFHRFQMVVWTVILIILFIDGVYRNLAMPEFSGTLLALMGISSGTYLGFKIPELQSK